MEERAQSQVCADSENRVGIKEAIWGRVEVPTLNRKGGEEGGGLAPVLAVTHLRPALSSVCHITVNCHVTNFTDEGR